MTVSTPPTFLFKVMDQKYLDASILCEVCSINPAKYVKGGMIIFEGKEKRDLFLCCEGCREMIQEARLKDRTE